MHICRTPVTTEQYLWDQIKKWTGHLEDVFIDIYSVKHYRKLTHIQVKMCHKDKWEDRTPIQQSQGTYARTDMSDSQQDCVIGRDTLKKEHHEKQSRLHSR